MSNKEKNEQNFIINSFVDALVLYILKYNLIEIIYILNE